MLNTENGILTWIKSNPICCSKSDNPENPPGNRPAVLAKQRRFHAYKSEAKKKNIPFICTKRSISCVYDEYVKIMGIKDCSSCYVNCAGDIKC